MQFEIKSLPSFSVILLGATGQGKTSVALELTKSAKFSPKSGKQSQTAEIVYDHSDPELAKKIKANFEVFDTIGYFSDNKNPTEILEAILDSIYLNSASKFLDAVILVMKLGGRAIEMRKLRENLRKSGLVEENKGKLSNCIVVLTFTDDVYEDNEEKDYFEIIKRDFAFLEDHIDDLNKIILWISSPSKKRLARVMEEKELYCIYDSQFTKLVKAIPKCTKIKFDMILKYRQELRERLLLNLTTLFKTNTIEKEPYYLPLSLNFSLKFNENGLLIDEYENSLDLKINKCSSFIDTTIFFSSCGLTAASFFVEEKKRNFYMGLVLVGVGFCYWNNNLTKNINTLNTSSKIKKQIEAGASLFPGIINQFFLEKKMNEIPLLNLYTVDKKTLQFNIAEINKKKLFESYNDYFRFEKAQTKSNEIKVSQIESENMVLSWNPEDLRSQRAEVRLDLVFKINMPKKSEIDQELKKIIEKNNNEALNQIKKVGN